MRGHRQGEQAGGEKSENRFHEKLQRMKIRRL